MATLRTIRRRIASIKNTQTITKAMQMVSAAKLRKAQDRVFMVRPFTAKISHLVNELGQGMTAEDHPFFTPLGEDKRRIGVILITSDKGLCGSFNNNIIFKAERDLKAIRGNIEKVSFITLGKKGRDFFLKKKAEIKKQYFEDRERTNYELAADIAREAQKLFLSGEWNEVYLYYSIFRSVMRYEPTKQILLPISPSPVGQENTPSTDYIFEPDKKGILNQLLPKFVETQILKAILESQASEHAARMTAMDTASNNCRELITDLTLVYNKARQAAITKELLDIVGGAEALKKK